MMLEKAIKLLKQYQGYEPMFPDGETLKHSFDLTDETVDTLLSALSPPNELMEALEAINNAAVAYIEGGPYENDLPGLELAMEIYRLSQDFVRPPEGEED